MCWIYSSLEKLLYHVNRYVVRNKKKSIKFNAGVDKLNAVHNVAKTSYEGIGPLNKTLPVLPQVDRREVVQTPTGKSVVIRQGDPRHPALITYHDLGLNYSTNFQVCYIIESV